MADAESNIRIDIDATAALDTLKNLQRQISVFHQNLAATGNAANRQVSENLQRNLINNINATGKFSASLESVKSTADNFTTALEKNKLSLGQYFKYGVASTQSFGKIFRSEFATIEKTARERVKTLQTQYIKMGRDANGAIQAIQVRPLMLDMENLATKTAMAAQKQQILNQLLKQGSTNLLNFGKNTQWAGRQLMVGFTIPLSIFGTTAVKSFKEMEEAVIKFQRVYGDFGTSAAETEKMVTQVKALANEFTKYGVAVADTMNLAADVAAMGKAGAELTAQVAEATRLAVLGGVEQSQALETTISMTNAFGTAAEDLAGKIDFLNSVENQTVTSIEDLTIAIPKAGPVIEQLGGSVEDLAFFLTAMKEGGINASEGANALKSGLASLINPTEKASEFMKGFGININGIVEANKGNVKGIVVDFAQALDTLDPLNRARAIEQLFGKFQFARLSTLFQNVIDEGSQASRVLDLTRASAAELAILSERELKRVEDSPLYKFQKALEDIQASLVPLGAEFLKLITPVIEFGTSLLKQFNSLDDGAKKFVTGLVAVIGLVAPAAIMTFGLVANGVANLIKGFTSYRTLLQKLSGATAMAGGSTEYLTQEQLQAMAAASSLNQVHSTLVQTFSAEKTAVQQLAVAYRQAVAAQSAFGGSQVANRPPRKFAAGGIVRGPGTGTSDSIPAMLSNGEAVIPAEQTKKYGALIQGIISNSIPGYSQGLFSMPPNYAEDLGNEARRRASIGKNYENLAAAGYEQEAQQAIQELDAFGASVSQARQLMGHLNKAAEAGPEAVSSWIAQLKQSTQEVSSGSNLIADMKAKTGVGVSTVTENFAHIGGGATYVDSKGEKQVVKSELGMSGFSPRVNAQLAKKGGAATEDFLEAYDTAGIEKWNHSIKKGGGNLEELSADIQIFDARLKEIIQTSGASKVFDLESDAQAYQATTGQSAISVQAAASQAMSEMSDSQLTEALATSASVPREVRRNGASTSLPAGFDKEEASIALSQAAESEGLAKTAGKDDATEYKQGAIQILGDGESDPFKIATPERNSPHPDAFGSGSDDFEAYAQGANSSPQKLPWQKDNDFGSWGSSAEDDRFASMSIEEAELFDDNAAKQRKRDSRTGIGGKAMNMFEDLTSGIREKAEKKIFDVLNVTGAPNRMSDGRIYESTTGKTFANDAEYDKYIADQKEAARLQKEAAIEMNGASETQTQAANMQMQDASDATDTRVGRKKAEKEKEVQDKKDARAAAASKRQRRAGAVAGVLGTATMGLGVMSMVGGPMAEFAQSIMPVVTGLSILGPLLLALPGPLGAIALVAGLVAFGLFKWNEMISQARESGKKFGNALSMSTNSLIAFSEATGKVSATEKRRREQEDILSSATFKKRQFGQTFLENEAGKSLLEDIKTMSESGLVSKTGTAQGVARKLAVSVAEGILSPGEANSIIAALGVELKNYEFATEVSATLTQLIGPNGKDLMTNPLEVMLDIQEQSQEQLDASFNVAIDQNYITDEVARMRKEFEDAKPLQGLEADLKYGFGASIAALLDPKTWGVFVDGLEIDKLTEKLQSASITLGINQIQQNQQLLDSLESQYDAKIAQAEKDLELEKNAEKRKKLEQEIVNLQNDKNSAMDTLNAANARSMQDIANMSKEFENGAQLFNDSIRNAVLANYKEDDPLRPFVEQALATLEGLQDSNFKAYIQLGFSTGELSLDAVNRLLEADSEVTAKFNVLVNEKGTADAGLLTDLLIKLNANDYTFNVQYNLASFGSAEDFDTQIAALQVLADLPTEYGFSIDINTDPERLVEVKQVMGILEEEPESITYTRLLDISEKNPGVFDGILNNWDEITGGADSITKEIIFEAISLGSVDILEWYMNSIGLAKSAQIRILESPTLKQKYTDSAVAKIIGGGKNEEEDGGTTDQTDTSGGGATPDDAVSSLLEALRRVRDAAIDAKGGVDELLRIAGKGKDLTIFNGLDQQLLSRGWNEEFRSFISGLEQGSEQANKFYKVNEKGILTLTAAGKALKNAFDQKILGDFQLTQVKTISDINNQRIALEKLTDAGVDLADAYKIVADAALAAAIANGKISADEWELLVKAINDATDALADFNAEQDIATQIDKLAIDAAITEFAKSKFPDLTSEMLSALLGVDEYYRQIMANLANGVAITQEQWDNFSKWWSEVFIPGLQTEVDVKPARSPEQIFQEGFSNAMRQFSAMEAEIQLKFAIDTKADQELIKAAENRIAEIQYQIDDYEAGLREIEDKENDINDKYDDRFEALDKIEKANANIAKQQRSQLTIADALSQGDIAAAAKAVLDAREQAAQEGILDQRQALEQQKENELANVRNKLGLTREEIEKRIKDLQDEIFKIEEEQLEPAQERIRLAQLIVDAQIEALTVLGKTKSEWEGIQNEIELAITKGNDFKSAMEDALGIIEQIRNGGLIGDDLTEVPSPGGTFPSDPGDLFPDPVIDPPAAEEPAKITKLSDGREIFTYANGDRYVKASKNGETAAQIATLVSKAFGKTVSAADLRLGGTNQNPDYLNSNQWVWLPKGFAKGGMVKPNYFNVGGFARGTDTVPAMLTPGEFVVRKYAVDKFGVDNLKAINSGTYTGSSVYNSYDINVNVRTDANPDQIANAVMSRIRQIDSQRIRGSRI